MPSSLVSSISLHRIWATVIRRDEYLSCLPRKNGLRKLIDGFLLSSAHLPSKTVKSFSLTTSCHLSARISSSPDVCHVLGHARESHVGGCLPTLSWLWRGLWQNVPLIGEKNWCKQFLSLNFKMKGTRWTPTRSSCWFLKWIRFRHRHYMVHTPYNLSLSFSSYSPCPLPTTLQSQAGIKFSLLECI